MARILFALLLLAACTPWVSPAMALVTGVLFGLTFHRPFAVATSRASRVLLQVAVVGLGFSMDLGQVLHAGRSGFLYTLLGIVFALSAGAVLCKVFSVERKTGFLISAGTAICGGSAIAAVGPVVEATDEQMSVSMGTVFLLNAFGLIVFPPLGHFFQLTETQFGLWAALAIHDTSSVVAAGARYGVAALTIATTVKLARALWIVPLTLAAPLWVKSTRVVQDGGLKQNSRRIPWPWFILFFLFAAVVRTYLPTGQHIYDAAAYFAHICLTVTLLLIGSGISRNGIKTVGARPLVMGVLLWMVVATVSLVLIKLGWIQI